MTSIVFSRVCRAMPGMLDTASTRAGSTRWWSLSAQLTCEAATPTGTENPSGNHPSHTQKTMRARRPSQKAGVEESR